MALRKTKSQWLALFEEQKQCGLSIAAFCKQKQLSETYFYLKRKKLQSQDKQVSTFVAARPESITPTPAVRTWSNFVNRFNKRTMQPEKRLTIQLF